MRIENQVCTLEQAKKLKKLGIKQGGILYWTKPPYEKFFLTFLPSTKDLVYQAYTVAELGEMFNKKNIDFQCMYFREAESLPMLWHYWIEDENGLTEIEVLGKTEAEARANLLIAILEK